MEARVVVEFAAQTETANIWLKVRRHAMRLKIFGLLSHLVPLHARLCRFLARQEVDSVSGYSQRDPGAETLVRS